MVASAPLCWCGVAVPVGADLCSQEGRARVSPAATLSLPPRPSERCTLGFPNVGHLTLSKAACRAPELLALLRESPAPPLPVPGTRGQGEWALQDSPHLPVWPLVGVPPAPRERPAPLRLRTGRTSAGGLRGLLPGEETPGALRMRAGGRASSQASLKNHQYLQREPPGWLGPARGLGGRRGRENWPESLQHGEVRRRPGWDWGSSPTGAGLQGRGAGQGPGLSGCCGVRGRAETRWCPLKPRSPPLCPP